MPVPFNATITVDDLAALALVHMADFPWGSTAWVKTVPFGPDGAVYVLLKTTTLVPNGTTVIQAIAGSPSAGNAGAVWAFLVQPSTNPTGAGFVYIRPIDGVTDDWPSLHAILVANAYKNIVVMLPGEAGEHYQADSQMVIPAGSTIWGTAGTIIDANLPGPPSIRDCVFTMVATLDGGIPLVLDNVVGSRVLRLGANPGVGTYLQCSVGPAHLSGSTYRVVAVTPVGPDFDVLLDRSVLYPLLAIDAAIVVATDVPMDIRIEGNGMQIRGTASNYVQMQGAIHCYVDGLVLDGATGPGTFAGTCITIDAMGTQCAMSNLIAIGDGVTPGQVGIWSVAESVTTTNVVACHLTTGILFEGLGSSLDTFLSYNNVVGVQVTANGGAAALPSRDLSLQCGLVYGCTSNGIVVVQGSYQIDIVDVHCQYNNGSGLVLQNIFTPQVVDSVSVRGGSYTNNGVAGISDEPGVNNIRLTDVDISNNAQSGLVVFGRMFVKGIVSRGGNVTAAISVLDGARLTLEGFNLVMDVLGSQAIQMSGESLLRALDGRIQIVQGGSALQLNDTSKSFIDRLSFQIDGAATLVLLNGVAGLVACISHIDASGGALGASVGVDVAVACTARLGERVNVDGCGVPFNFIAGSYWSRSVDSMAPNTFVTIGGGGAAVPVAFPDLKDSDRVEVQRVAPAPPPAGVTPATVTKTVGVGFAVTPEGVADAGSVYAYTVS